MHPRSLIYALGAVPAFFIASVALAAWSPPPAGSPPSNCTSGTQGCDAPINVSATTQTKSGALNLSGALTAPNVTATNLCFGLDCRSSWSSVGSQWTTNGTSIYYNTGNVGLGVAAPSQKIDVAGNITANLYYDRENPAYYVDPAGISSLYRLDVDHVYDRNNYTYYVDPNNVSVFQDIRPSVIYDRDNTGYYLNPDATSYVNTLSAAGGINVAGSWVCRENGTNCPQGTGGVGFGGMFGMVNGGCMSANAYTGGCSCPGWAGAGRVAFNTADANFALHDQYGTNRYYAVWYCTN